jgi:hypothetical protein
MFRDGRFWDVHAAFAAVPVPVEAKLLNVVSRASVAQGAPPRSW